MRQPRHEFDKSSKWMIQKHGDDILYLAGIRKVRSWRPLQAELVQPRRLPDGLLEVLFHGRKDPDYFLLEIATFPEKRISEQAMHDLTLAFHQLEVLPELLTVALSPKGSQSIQGNYSIESRLQWSRLTCCWKVVALWELPAEELLSAGHVGLLPWIPLTKFEGAPEPILEKCRRQIDQQAAAPERENLLAVSQVLARLRYNSPELLAILGGKRVMIESPLIKEILAENMQDNILDFLRARFDEVTDDIEQRLRTIRNEKKLRTLIKHAGRCSDLEAFRKRLLS